MRISVLITILICAIFLSGCNSNKNLIEDTRIPESLKRIDLKWEKVKSVPLSKSPTPLLFSDDTYLNVFYPSPQGDKAVIERYDKDLNLEVEKEFLAGQGPGELSLGYHFSQVENRIYGIDFIQLRYTIFDTDFNYLDTIKSETVPRCATFSRRGDFLVGFTSARVEKGYTYFLTYSTFPGLKRKKILSLGPYWLWNENKRFISGTVPNYSLFVRGDKIYFIDTLAYRIIQFDKEGNKLKQVCVDVEEIKTPRDKKKEWLADQVGPRQAENCDLADIVHPASCAVPLEKGFVVVRRNGFQIDCENFASGDYFDYDLNLIGKVEIPCFHRIYLVIRAMLPYTAYCRNSHLYLVREDSEREETYLEKWRLEE